MSFKAIVYWCIYAGAATLLITGLLSLASGEQLLLWLMSVYSIVYFTLFCIVLFSLAQKAVQSKDLNAINKLFMVSVLVKLATALAVVVGFLKWYQPEENLFVLPFIVAYIAFTAVEVFSLKKLVKTS
jgi:hypothetical protein